MYLRAGTSRRRFITTRIISRLTRGRDAPRASPVPVDEAGRALFNSAMRELDVKLIEEAVAALSVQACVDLPPDVTASLEKSASSEESPSGREVLGMLVENARLAREEHLPLCQDTGLAVVFLEIGQDVHLTGGDLSAAVDRGVARGYADGFLRKSVVADPLQRTNTGDNTPAILHLFIVPGEAVRVIVAPKGGGSENRSALTMLSPSDGVEGVRRFVVETVSAAGPDACPPFVVGVGVGGDFAGVALLAKRALLREIGSRHPDRAWAVLEADLLAAINGLGIGPAGLGGRITALDVFVEARPCHIASLPVAVNLNCHAARHRERTL
jgi:fumarate hydratase subunit alpha